MPLLNIAELPRARIVVTVFDPEEKGGERKVKRNDFLRRRSRSRC
jgi:hypothetical protein